MTRRRLSILLVLGLVASLLPLAAAPAISATTDLFFSEYVEGSSNNKAIEIYNGTGTTVDLSTYTVEIYNNGAPTPNNSESLAGTLADGDVLVIANSSADAAILAEADLTSAVTFFNGDDALVLKNSGTVIDAFGQVGVDPGSEWTGGGLNDTLRRKATVCSGDTDATDAFDASAEWDTFAQDTFGGLGSHTANCDGGPTGPVINEFVANHTGSDTEAFIEILGEPSTDYSNLTILEIEGDSSGAGVVDAVITVGVTDAEGFWTDDEDMENGTISVLLVSDFSGSFGQDLDADNDGTLDLTPWTEIVDSVAVTDGGSSDRTYGTTTLEPNYDGLSSFSPGGASRIPNGTDSDAISDWMRNDFDGAGFFGFFGTPEIGEAFNTPGAVNEPITISEDPFGACSDPATLISTIQDSGFSSPESGNKRTIEGIVVGDFETFDSLAGFFLQEEDSDTDGDPATSEGIFVFNSWRDEVSVGDVVRAKGTVTEFFGLTELTDVTDLEVCGTATPPAPTDLTGPVPDSDREAVEGMLVTFTDTLYVTDTFNLHTFGEVWLGMGSVIEQPTNELPAGPNMEALAAENIERSILLEDDRTGELEPGDPIPFLHANGTLRLGDSTDSLTGVMSYGFGQYRIHATQAVDFDETNPRPVVPDVGGDLVVGSFNVLNYWTTIGCGFECRGAQTPEQLAAQTAGLVEAIRGMGADIVALQEMENPVGFDYANKNSPAHDPINTLVDALNAAEGSTVWKWVGPADHYNDYPIRNEIIYKADSVNQVGGPDAFADPAFDAIAPSGTPYARPPLAQTFVANGEMFTIVVNHFKSKGSPCNEPNENADGQGNCNLQRIAEANALLDFVSELESFDPDVLVVGDLNSYMKEDPILALEGSLVNLVTEYDSDPWSYNFFATFAFPFVGRGSLDHAFATDSMAAQVTGTETWHINADEPRFLDWFDPSKTAAPYRSSDHDPVIIGIALEGKGPKGSGHGAGHQ